MAVIKVWLKDRWEMLFPLLQALTVDQQEEIKRLCDEEIEHWRGRGISDSALRVPMTETRKQIKQWPLTDINFWVNPRTREKEHIALKYMNFSVEEWAAMNAPSGAKFQARLEDVKFIDSPDAVVAKAVELLGSEHWYDIACGLAVVIGRRYEELVSAGELFPRTPFTLTFKGQLKTKEKILPPYEIPVLCESSLALDAWRRLRASLAARVNTEILSDGRLVTDSAQKHFSGLVPARSGGDLYTHLFRSVYGCIAVFYYAPAEILAIKYLATIYGHYWVLESTGEQQHNYITTLHYQDYQVSDAAVAAHNGKRQGIKLATPGVEMLEAFSVKPVIETKKKGAKMTDTTTTTVTEKASKTGFSMYKPSQATKLRLDEIKDNDASLRIEDDVLRLLVDEHYQLQQLNKLGINLDALVSLLADAAVDVQRVRKEAADKKIATYTAKKRPLPLSPVDYLRDLVTEKRDFGQSYEKRHAGKDYSSMSLSELRDTKTTEAANERFSRAVAAIIAFNAAASVPEQRWFINAKVITDLVGGKPSLASTYLDGRQAELDAHHKQYNLTSAYNRRPVKITDRLRVPETPGVVAFEPVVG